MVLAVLMAVLALTTLQGGTAAAPPVEPAAAVQPPAMTAADTAAIHAMASHPSWVRRLTATLRMERWAGADPASTGLADLANDPDARVRASAVLTYARTGAAYPASRLNTETDARVIRTMLRCGLHVDAERIEAGARHLMKSRAPTERLMGVELVAALDVQKRAPRPLVALARDTFVSIIARLDREAAGTLSPRMAALTGGTDSRIDHRWRSWLRRNRLSYTLDGGMLTGAGAEAASGADLNDVAKLSPEDFVRFTAALDEAFRKPIDLAIVIDCTASMSGELAQAQGGVHDVMAFAAAAAGGMRLAVVGYRDQGDEWKTKASDFANTAAQARANLWQLRADGGGDEPEMVYEALRIAFTRLAWRAPQHVQQVLVLIGDAPPHPGYGGHSIELARAGKAAGITTFVISARDERKAEEVKHFPEIARAGGGRVIRLSARRDLAAELAGIALADTWHDPIVAIFERYLLLGRE